MRALAIIAAASVCVAAGCASRPDAIAPVYVPASEYSHLTCDETRTQLAERRQLEEELSRTQNRAATADAAGVFLVLVPLGSVVGSDVEGELALAKGEVRALEQALTLNCE